MAAMSQAPFQVNRAASPKVHLVGAERTPVVIIDEFAVEPADLIDYACASGHFNAEASSAYPGVRAPMTQDQVVVQLRALAPLLRKVYEVPQRLYIKPVNAAFSLITTPETDLNTLQRLPHIDSTRPYYFAITHYLNSGAFGGTGLYRHQPTGFEKVTEERLPEYVRSGDAYLAAHGEPASRYFGRGDDHFAMFDCIDYRSNRLVCYPGALLHSGLVDPDVDINGDPRTGRLTANTFVEFSQ